MEALEKNKTLGVGRLPKIRSERCKWYYTINNKADGTLEGYKIKLVVTGYTQAYEANHQETLVAKMNTIRITFGLTIV